MAEVSERLGDLATSSGEIGDEVEFLGQKLVDSQAEFTGVISKLEKKLDEFVWLRAASASEAAEGPDAGVGELPRVRHEDKEKIEKEFNVDPNLGSQGDSGFNVDPKPGIQGDSDFNADPKPGFGGSGFIEKDKPTAASCEPDPEDNVALHAFVGWDPR